MKTILEVKGQKPREIDRRDVGREIHAQTKKGLEVGEDFQIYLVPESGAEALRQRVLARKPRSIPKHVHRPAKGNNANYSAKKTPLQDMLENFQLDDEHYISTFRTG